jgi:hypothetical protein
VRNNGAVAAEPAALRQQTGRDVIIWLGWICGTISTAWRPWLMLTI